ncbi:hypothetical protein ABZ566_31745, partial [Streptomyces hygroscopicus]|uniref:hypothetical protein n=1 Tax=Streptomyces hygroscopicus TaxID=1912 RepID=UPI0033FECB54
WVQPVLETSRDLLLAHASHWLGSGGVMLPNHTPRAAGAGSTRAAAGGTRRAGSSTRRAAGVPVRVRPPVPPIRAAR